MKHYRNFYLFCGLLMLCSEIWKQLTLTFQTGHAIYNWWYFPFQLCSIPMYLCLILGFTGNKYSTLHSTLMTFLMDFGMLGGVFAFFDTSGMHYSSSSLTIHSYAWHILLIIIGIYSGLNKNTDHSYMGFMRSVLLYLACCGAATIFNVLFHPYGLINMFYISPYYQMEQKVFRNFVPLIGNTGAILLYIACCILGSFMIHCAWKKYLKQ